MLEFESTLVYVLSLDNLWLVTSAVAGPSDTVERVSD